MAEKKKLKTMKPFKAWVVVDKLTGKFVYDGGIGLARSDSASMEGERHARVLVTEVPRAKR